MTREGAWGMVGLFITGTSTDVGKTYVAALIARALVDSGKRVGVYKPVESGCRREGDSLIAADARQLWEAAKMPGDLSKVCPQRFEAALSPPQAAALEDKNVDPQLLRNGVDYWRDRSDFVLVEGAGGWMSPLSGDHSNADYNADLAVDLGLPLVIVVDNRLGAINAALQTILTARAVAPQLPIAGVILNQTALLGEDTSVGRNAEELRARCEVPLLAEVGHGERKLLADVDWFSLGLKRSEKQ